MRWHIVADGAERVRRSAQLHTQLRQLRQSIAVRYAKQLAEAGFFRRLLLHWRMAGEYQRERRRIVPSEQTLYLGRITTGETKGDELSQPSFS